MMNEERYRREVFPQLFTHLGHGFPLPSWERARVRGPPAEAVSVDSREVSAG